MVAMLEFIIEDTTVIEVEQLVEGLIENIPPLSPAIFELACESENVTEASP